MSASPSSIKENFSTPSHCTTSTAENGLGRHRIVSLQTEKTFTIMGTGSLSGRGWKFESDDGEAIHEVARESLVMEATENGRIAQRDTVPTSNFPRKTRLRALAGSSPPGISADRVVHREQNVSTETT